MARVRTCRKRFRPAEIRTKDGFPRQCIGPVLRSAELWRGALDGARFAGKFGSTQCRKITGCDFSDTGGVSRYIDGELITRCRTIGCKVAEQVELMLAVGSVE